jgi:hypothetical protein
MVGFAAEKGYWCTCWALYRRSYTPLASKRVGLQFNLTACSLASQSLKSIFAKKYAFSERFASRPHPCKNNWNMHNNEEDGVFKIEGDWAHLRVPPATSRSTLPKQLQPYISAFFNVTSTLLRSCIVRKLYHRTSWALHRSRTKTSATSFKLLPLLSHHPCEYGWHHKQQSHKGAFQELGSWFSKNSEASSMCILLTLLLVACKTRRSHMNVDHYLPSLWAC